MEPVLGIDGARAGWVGARLDDDGSVELHLSPTLADLLDLVGPVDIVAVDMPLALVDGPRRPVDTAARSLLGPRRSSIFPAPPVGALAFADEDYSGANAWSKATHGVGISKQAWNLVPRIREAADWHGSGRAPGLHECSPELSFAALAGDEPVAHPKTTWAGLARRLELLNGAGIRIPADIGAAGVTAPDDVLDSVALAWSARRIRDGVAQCAPDPPDGPLIHW